MELTTARTLRGRSRTAERERSKEFWGWGGGEAATEVRVVENPVTAQDPELGRALEAALQELLGGEGLGRVDVRFRVCREQAHGLAFICKVEGPPAVDPQRGREQFRWWSPLMQSVEDLVGALLESLEIRRQRLALTRRPASA